MGAFVTLATVYPCCKGRARFKAAAAVPRERYERACPRCGCRWEVERRTVSSSSVARIDTLEWEEAAA